LCREKICSVPPRQNLPPGFLLADSGERNYTFNQFRISDNSDIKYKGIEYKLTD
jgi:hypothetical protein